MNKSKLLSEALRWMSEARKDRPEAKLLELVGEASQRFNLSPVQSDALFEMILAEDNALKKGGEK